MMRLGITLPLDGFQNTHLPELARHAEKLVRDAFIWSHLAGDTVQRLKVAARLARVAAQH